MFSKRIKTHHSAMLGGREYSEGIKKVVEILEKPKADNHNATIYIHVPFCNKICTFCNMRRALQKPSREYADLIIKEIENYAALPYIKKTLFDAVYFGGGTPTTLETEDLVKILQGLKENFKFTLDAEITIETTVTELESRKLETLIKEGVNRFSVGVQTFNDAGRKLMGRIGSGAYAYKKLEEIKSYKDVIVSMDLIYNYKGQRLEDLYEDLQKIRALELDGFSMYSLINMKQTVIEEAQDEMNDKTMFFTISHTMESAGYQFLELTKMVKKDQYKYIKNRHEGADTCPLGAGAGGNIGGLALMNPIDTEAYKKTVEQFKRREAMYFNPSYREVTKFKGDIQLCQLPRNEQLYRSREKYEEVLAKFIREQLVEENQGSYYLTKKGIFWGNTISRELSSLI